MGVGHGLAKYDFCVLLLCLRCSLQSEVAFGGAMSPMLRARADARALARGRCFILPASHCQSASPKVTTAVLFFLPRRITKISNKTCKKEGDCAHNKRSVSLQTSHQVKCYCRCYGSYRAKTNFDSVFSFSGCIFGFHIFSLNSMLVIIVGP